MKNQLIRLTVLVTSFSTMTQELKKISYRDGSVTHLAETIIVKQYAPGVLILPAWSGIDDEARNAAKDLANQGYNVSIADIYGTTDTSKNMESAKKMSAFYKQNPDKYQIGRAHV